VADEPAVLAAVAAGSCEAPPRPKPSAAEQERLMQAALFGDVATLRALLSRGPYRPDDVRDNSGNTLCLVAAMAWQWSAVSALVALGANPLVKNNRGWDLVHLCASQTTRPTDWSILSRVVFDWGGATAINDGDDHGCTPLHKAVVGCRWDVAAFLVRDAGASVDHCPDPVLPLTLLQRVAMACKWRAVEGLLALGARPQALPPCDRDRPSEARHVRQGVHEFAWYRRRHLACAIARRRARVRTAVAPPSAVSTLPPASDEVRPGESETCGDSTGSR